PAAIEHAEDGIPRGHAKVAKQCQLQPAGHRVSFDRRDGGLGELHPCRAHRGVTLGVDCLAAALGDLTQVGAGTECTLGAGEYGDVDIVVAFERLESLGQSFCRSRINRIARPRTIDGYCKDLVVSLDQQRFRFRHLISSANLLPIVSRSGPIRQIRMSDLTNSFHEEWASFLSLLNPHDSYCEP